MITVLAYAVSSLIFGAGFMLAYKYVKPATRLSLRGRRILFVIGLIVGAGVYYLDSHIFWTCTQAGCGYTNGGF